MEFVCVKLWGHWVKKKTKNQTVCGSLGGKKCNIKEDDQNKSQSLNPNIDTNKMFLYDLKFSVGFWAFVVMYRQYRLTLTCSQ